MIPYNKALLLLLKQPVVILDLKKLPKNKTHLTYQEKLNNIQEGYSNHLDIFTDGSKSNNGTRCIAVLHQKTLKKHLPKETFIFSAKICAINLALKLVSTRKSSFIQTPLLFFNLLKIQNLIIHSLSSFQTNSIL